MLTHKFGAPPPPPAGPSPSGGVAGNVDSGSGGGVDGRKEWVSPGSLSGLSGLPPLVDVSKPNPKSKAPLTGAPPPASALKDPLAPPTGRRIQKKPSRQRSADEVRQLRHHFRHVPRMYLLFNIYYRRYAVPQAPSPVPGLVSHALSAYRMLIDACGLMLRPIHAGRYWRTRRGLPMRCPGRSTRTANWNHF